jgi:hypothetical protein
VFDVVPELAMLQSFSSGPTLPGRQQKTPLGLRRRGLEFVLFRTLRRIADDDHHRHDDHRGWRGF